MHQFQRVDVADDTANVNGGGDGGNGGAPTDDFVLPFQTVRSNISGRIVRLGPSLSRILSRHQYPNAVSEALGQSLALTSLLGTALKIEGRLILQTKTDGPLNMLVVNYDTPGHLRGYANFDPQRLQAELDAHKVQGTGHPGPSQPFVLGSGHLAMTIDPEGDMDRYQGIVALDRETLTDAALHYFRQSEQLPTFLRLAVARVYEPGRSDSAWTWRAGGLLLQHIAHSGGTPQAEIEGEPLPLSGEDDDDWRRTEILASTVEDHELIDPNLAPHRLLYRLFHEEGVRVQPPHRLIAHCRCSRERVTNFLSQFAAEGLDDLRELDGAITVTCEFCGESYRFEPGEME